MNGKIIVAGGSGFIGSNIVGDLWKAGMPLGILCRHPGEARKKMRDIEIDYVRGDVRDPRTLPRALEGVETIVACVQFPNHPIEDPSKGYTYEKFDAEGTRNLVRAAREAGVKRFIYLSGAGTRPDRPNLDREPWFRAKIVAEEAVRSSGLLTTIVRPSWVYGREDRSLNRFADFIRLLPVVPVIGNGQNRVQPLFIRDLVQAIHKIIEQPDVAAGKTYELGGPENLTMDEIIAIMLEVMHKRRAIVHQPKWLLKLAARPMKLLPRPPLSPQAIDFITMEEPVDNTKLLSDFRDLKLTRLRDALATYLSPPETAI